MNSAAKASCDLSAKLPRHPLAVLALVISSLKSANIWATASGCSTCSQCPPSSIGQHVIFFCAEPDSPTEQALEKLRCE